MAKKLKRGHEAVYRVVRQLKNGLTAIDIYLQYKKNKSKCGRKKIQLTSSEKDYINEKVHQGWTPDVIIGRKERPISCSMRTFYRKFKKGEFNQDVVPMNGKRKPNGYQEKRGKQSFIRGIRDRDKEHP